MQWVREGKKEEMCVNAKARRRRGGKDTGLLEHPLRPARAGQQRLNCSNGLIRVANFPTHPLGSEELGESCAPMADGPIIRILNVDSQ